MAIGVSVGALIVFIRLWRNKRTHVAVDGSDANFSGLGRFVGCSLFGSTDCFTLQRSHSMERMTLATWKWISMALRIFCKERLRKAASSGRGVPPVGDYLWSIGSEHCRLHEGL